MTSALPRGFRDILPTEARELHAIERSLMTTFARHGYVPLEPPTVEFAEERSPSMNGARCGSSIVMAGSSRSVPT